MVANHPKRASGLSERNAAVSPVLSFPPLDASPLKQNCDTEWTSTRFNNIPLGAEQTATFTSDTIIGAIWKYVSITDNSGLHTF